MTRFLSGDGEHFYGLGGEPLRLTVNAFAEDYRNEAVRYRGKPYFIDPVTGRVKKDRNNKLVKLNGLDSKLLVQDKKSQ